MLRFSAITSLLILFLWIESECMFVRFERANVTLVNENYLYNVSLYVRRYHRKSPYFLHLTGNTKQPFTNNMTIDIIFSQFLHNEYRRSFIELHYKLCDLINNEPYIGGMVKLAGLSCPVKVGYHSYTNMSAPTQNFPNVFPFEKGRADVYVTVTSTKEAVFNLFVEASFKQ